MSNARRVTTYSIAGVAVLGIAAGAFFGGMAAAQPGPSKPAPAAVVDIPKYATVSDILCHTAAQAFMETSTQLLTAASRMGTPEEDTAASWLALRYPEIKQKHDDALIDLQDCEDLAESYQ